MIEYVKEQATLISHRCSLLTSDLFIAVEEWAEESFKKGVYLLELLKRQNGNKEVIEIVDVREMQELLLDQVGLFAFSSVNDCRFVLQASDWVLFYLTCKHIRQ